ncbi:hypothetical protein LPJ66_009308, partial [Kickxella alabastrina]
AVLEVQNEWMAMIDRENLMREQSKFRDYADIGAEMDSGSGEEDEEDEDEDFNPNRAPGAAPSGYGISDDDDNEEEEDESDDEDASDEDEISERQMAKLVRQGLYRTETDRFGNITYIKNDEDKNENEKKESESEDEDNEDEQLADKLANTKL